MFKTLGKIAHDCFTDSTGDTFAIGRLYSVPVLLTGLGVPLIQAITGKPVSLSELAILLPATAGACWVMITGNNRIDEALPRPHLKGPPDDTQ